MFVRRTEGTSSPIPQQGWVVVSTVDLVIKCVTTPLFAVMREIVMFGQEFGAYVKTAANGSSSTSVMLYPRLRDGSVQAVASSE